MVHPIKKNRIKKTRSADPTKKNKRSFLSLKDFSAGSILVFYRGWAVLFGLVALGAFWQSLTWLKLPSMWNAFALLPIFLNLKLISYALATANISGLRRFLGFSASRRLGVRLFLIAEYVALSFGITLTACLFSYLVLTWDIPLVDVMLSRWDRALAFDWREWFDRFRQLPPFIPLWLAYAFMIPQLFIFIMWFGYREDQGRLYEFFWIQALAFGATVILSGLLPSIGPIFLKGPLTAEALKDVAYGGGMFHAMSDVLAVKNGISPYEKSRMLFGIITFPSYHTVCALIYMYVFRGTGALGRAVVLLNALMLVTIPVCGNHYLVDMIAGAVIAGTAIAVVRFMRGKRPD